MSRKSAEAIVERLVISKRIDVGRKKASDRGVRGVNFGACKARNLLEWHVKKIDLRCLGGELTS